MKYTRLTKEQFEIFHEKFAEFLATQQIDNSEWKKIVETNPKMTEEQLDLFSDIVWEDALKNAEYLEHVDPKDLKVFRFKGSKVKMISIKIKGDLDIDLTKSNGITKVFENIMDSRIVIHQGNKKVGRQRNEEMFQLITEGCMITDERIYNALNEAIS
ncbi:MAG: hypothetical protein KAH10_09320 [Flavobacteriales bacterium]|nr:hypothetical protein [Flavobacteriales bacterium]